MITDDELDELERAVELALRSGDASGLSLLGEGEISLVLAAGSEPGWACKRLPPFATAEAADRYTSTIGRYIDELERRGVDVVHTEVRRVDGTDGTVVLYCVQPVMPKTNLAVDIARDEPDRAPALIADVIDTVFTTIDARIGLDAQLSNWAVVDGRLTYFDITTPLMRGADGVSELDADVFLASLPWALRAPVRRFVLPGILERYHDPRTVSLDLASNLIKEHLDDLVPAVLDSTAGRVATPLSEEEVRADRRSDARLWATLQAVRRADRAWQRHVRRRPYPFLLPGHANS
jgi:hypothetical protein